MKISSFINFKDKIQNNINDDKISLVAEIKKASPSAGIIIENYNPIEIAKIYTMRIKQRVYLYLQNKISF